MDWLGIVVYGGIDIIGDGLIEGIMRERGMEFLGDKERKVFGRGILVMERDVIILEEIGFGGRG